MATLMRFLLVLISCAAMVLAASAAPARAESAMANLLLILDCSGSMWGRVEGKPKITVAKDVTRELIGEVPEKVRLGLMAYGHRKKGDCKDIELIGKLGAEKSTLDRTVQGLSAKGKTPIADALTQAGGLLAASEGETTVVLVSDGLETCGGDPCQVAGQLRAKGLKVVIHVVGFDVNQAEAAQLKCIAAAGGGQYFQADNLAQLKAALGKIKASVVEQKPLPPAPQAAETSAAQAKSKTVKIAGPGTVKLKLASWAKLPRSWSLVDAESGQEAAKGDLDQLKAKAGEYQIVWQQSEHNHQPVMLNEVVRVQSGKTVEAAIDTGIRITAPKGFKPPKLWYVTEPSGKDEVYSVAGSLDPQVAPAGVYDLWWWQDEHKSTDMRLGRITVESGKLNDVLVDHGVNLQPADWLKELYYYVLEDEKGGRLVYKWSFFGPQIAPPGKYKLVLRPSEHGHEDLLWGEIVVPEHGFVDAPINSGARFLHQKGAKPPYRIIFVNLDNKREYVARQTWDPLPLPPGRYRLDWWEKEHGTKRQTLAEDVTVEAGVMLEVEM